MKKQQKAIGIQPCYCLYISNIKPGTLEAISASRMQHSKADMTELYPKGLKLLCTLLENRKWLSDHLLYTLEN